MNESRSLRTQALRFGVVGIASNAVLYVLYLLLTAAGLGPKPAMTLAYVVGLGQTFVLNRRWSFAHHGGVGGALGRYLAVYAFGYGLNFAILWLAVDRLGWPHQWVQAGAVVVVAGSVFLASKYWVFTPGARDAAT